MTNAIEILGLKFSYGSQTILDIPEFNIAEGEIVFLYGPSGSGKSTLLELIAGVLPVQSGHLQVLGDSFETKSNSELDHFRAENVGYIFQSFNLIPYLSVEENIRLPMMFSKSLFEQNRFNALIEGLSLKPFLKRQVTDLSVGQQQRVAVARALLKKPKIILADEPTSALDYDHREKFLQLLFQFCKKDQTSVLFVSHDRTIEKLFDRVVGLPSINLVKPWIEVLP